MSLPLKMTYGGRWAQRFRSRPESAVAALSSSTTPKTNFKDFTIVSPAVVSPDPRSGPGVSKWFLYWDIMRVTVFGSARVNEESQEYKDARRLGALLAGRGDVIVSGGYGGVMEAVSRGAREVGGQVVGVTVAPWIG